MCGLWFRCCVIIAYFVGTLGALQAQEVASGEGATVLDPALISQGQGLFEGNCTVCHKINEEYVGPALRDVHQRRSVEWIIKFVRNSQKVIESGDDYAVALFAKYNQTQMTAFDFSDQEIQSIVTYIIAESAKPIPSQEVASTQGAGGEATSGGVSETQVQYLWYALFAVLVLIVVILTILSSFLRNQILQRNNLSEDDKEDMGRSGGLGRALKSDAFLAIVVFFFAAVLFKTGIDSLYSVGIQQGYTPTQPIAFSHEIHAGQYEIDCNYCHTGAYKGKSAGIPSANICMNCHGEIRTDSPEIQKISQAITNNKPIEWVRVHNLPDLAYFNHSQHTQVGKIACQTCHGPIEEMAVVRQHAPLTMGWCINCHRTTLVNTEGNEYYDNLVEIHEESPLHVEDIGGTECSKCHY